MAANAETDAETEAGATDRLHLRVEVPDPGHDELPIQIQAGADRVTVTDDGDIILGIDPDESEGLRSQLRGVERTVRLWGGVDG